MSALKLSRRDDPLATAPKPASRPESPPPAEKAAAREGGESSGEKPPGKPGQEKPRRSDGARRGAGAKRRSAGRVGEGGPYDEDRLEQTGWRIYESVLEEVRAAAEELSAAGLPTSAASYAAAVLARRAPVSLDEKTELMREWNQLIATRRKRSA